MSLDFHLLGLFCGELYLGLGMYINKGKGNRNAPVAEESFAVTRFRCRIMTVDILSPAALPSTK